jgi:hypothetical protein
METSPYYLLVEHNKMHAAKKKKIGKNIPWHLPKHTYYSTVSQNVCDGGVMLQVLLHAASG